MADPAPGKVEADRAGWFVRDYFPDGVCPVSTILLDAAGSGVGIDFAASSLTTGIDMSSATISGDDIVLSGSGVIMAATSIGLEIAGTSKLAVTATGIKLDATVTLNDDGTIADSSNVMTITQNTITVAGATKINLDGPVDVSGAVTLDTAETTALTLSGATYTTGISMPGGKSYNPIHIGTKANTVGSGLDMSGADSYDDHNGVMIFCDDGGSLATTYTTSAIWTRYLISQSQSSNTATGAYLQMKSLAATLTACDYSATKAYLELSGAVTLASGGLAVINAGLELGGAFTDTANMLSGVDVNLNDGTNALDTAKNSAGVRIRKTSTSTAGWPIGLYIEDSGATIGIEIGNCTTGVTLTGAMTTGMSVTGATTNAVLAEVDSTSANNSKIGINISKDLTNATAAGALSSTNQAINIASVNASSASASGVLTVSSGLITASQANSTAVAQADVYSATLLALTYSATTTSSGTATSSAKGIAIDYDLTETAGTLSVDDFSIFDIDFDTTGTVSYLAGTYNAINVNMVDAGVPTHATSTVFNGLQIDASGLDVSDGDMTLSGIKVTVPTATNAVYVAGGNIAMGTSAARLSSTTEEDRFLSCYYTAAGKNIYGWYLNISQTYATDGAPRGLTIRTSLDHTSGSGPQGANSVDARVTLGDTNTGISGEMHAMESQLKIDADTRSLSGTYSAHKFTNYIKDGNTMPATTFFLRFVDQNGASVATPLMFDFSGLTAGASNCIVANTAALAAAEYFLRVKSPDGGVGYIPILSSLN